MENSKLGAAGTPQADGSTRDQAIKLLNEIIAEQCRLNQIDIIESVLSSLRSAARLDETSILLHLSEADYDLLHSSLGGYIIYTRKKNAEEASRVEKLADQLKIGQPLRSAAPPPQDGNAVTFAGLANKISSCGIDESRAKAIIWRLISEGILLCDERWNVVGSSSVGAVPPDEEAERAKFEAELSSHFNNPAQIKHLLSRCDWKPIRYAKDSTEDRWQGWLAARRASGSKTKGAGNRLCLQAFKTYGTRLPDICQRELGHEGPCSVDAEGNDPEAQERYRKHLRGECGPECLFTHGAGEEGQGR